jgi:hypothetical protein
MNKKAEELKKLIDEIPDLLKLNWKTPNEGVWTKKVLRFLKKEFSESSDYYKQFLDRTWAGSRFAVRADTSDPYFQKSRDDRLHEYKLLLESFFEELKDLPEQEIQQVQQFTNQNHPDDKLTELQHEIAEAKLEAERRKAVVETKTYGAVIEIITELRTELKRKDEIRKKILDLESKINQISEKISNDKTKLALEFEEDRLYAEIAQSLKEGNRDDKNRLLVSARQILVEIKGLRDEINILQKQYTMSDNTFERARLENEIRNRTKNMTPLLKNLSKIWGDSIQ